MPRRWPSSMFTSTRVSSVTGLSPIWIISCRLAAIFPSAFRRTMLGLSPAEMEVVHVIILGRGCRSFPSETRWEGTCSPPFAIPPLISGRCSFSSGAVVVEKATAVVRLIPFGLGSCRFPDMSVCFIRLHEGFVPSRCPTPGAYMRKSENTPITYMTENTYDAGSSPKSPAPNNSMSSMRILPCSPAAGAGRSGNISSALNVFQSCVGPLPKRGICGARALFATQWREEGTW
mmetsp:Transcript_2639/g.6563  ORF Transcript_2639/g.6563 Transcript_2639/m.6563 type:complete len:232 (-) Transcript_2639:213-908(-)